MSGKADDTSNVLANASRTTAQKFLIDSIASHLGEEDPISAQIVKDALLERVLLSQVYDHKRTLGFMEDGKFTPLHIGDLDSRSQWEFWASGDDKVDTRPTVAAILLDGELKGDYVLMFQLRFLPKLSSAARTGLLQALDNLSEPINRYAIEGDALYVEFWDVASEEVIRTVQQQLFLEIVAILAIGSPLVDVQSKFIDWTSLTAPLVDTDDTRSGNTQDIVDAVRQRRI